MKRIVSLTTLLVLMLLPVAAGAQFGGLFDFAGLNVDPNSSLPNELDIELIPSYPKPHMTVFVNLAMYTENLDSAVIEWILNGKRAQIGRGVKKFSFKTGEAGEKIVLEIRIVLSRGAEFKRSFTINPADVELVWEADSYVTPFYKGKALHPRQGRLKVVAMPEFVSEGKRISPKNLIYEWSDGQQAYQSQSGYGRNILVIDGDLLRSVEEIEVLVKDPTNNLTAEAFLDVPTVEPEIIFYENDPYYGFIFDQALPPVFDLEREEVQVLAAPYFTTKDRAGLEYSWRLNNKAAPELASLRSVVFRKPDGESGQSAIRLEVKSLNRMLQFAEKTLTLRFGN